MPGLDTGIQVFAASIPMSEDGRAEPMTPWEYWRILEGG
jgi:hypothetical protein